jgi:RNA polymerase sigma-70 factor (ECF subfamily)
MHATLAPNVTRDHQQPDSAVGTVSIQWVVDAHLNDVYRYAYRLAGNRPDAEDVTQQVFLLAQRHLDQVRDRRRVKPWLLTIVRNTYLKLHRRQRPQNAASAHVEMEWFPGEPGADPAIGDALQAALNGLDDHHRQVVLMFYFEDLSYRQIAERLNIKLGTVMSRLARAKTCLREVYLSQTK